MQKVTDDIRRQEVMAAVERCVEVLKTRFGARRVIPFGSVAGKGIWHSGSDLDLAVEGLASERFFHAWASLREVLPSDVDVDMVPLEDASPELRARILAEEEMSDNPILTLKGLIEDELTTLRRTVEEMEEGLSHLALPPSQFEMNALASYIHQFYTGCERILERIAIQVDGGLPGGAFSHANLLDQMARERPGVRPPVLDEELWLCLQDYLEFRHFFRHAYGYTLEWAKLSPMAEGIRGTLANLQRQLMIFFDALIAGRGETPQT